MLIAAAAGVSIVVLVNAERACLWRLAVFRTQSEPALAVGCCGFCGVELLAHL